jgi:hypothetical protein
MDYHKSALERAFELAREGSCSSVTHIRRRMQREGYQYEQVEGRELHRQLRALILQAPGFSPDLSKQ